MGIFKEIIIYILATTWFFMVLRWDLLSDFKKWKNNIPVKHTEEAIQRVLLLLPSIILLLYLKLSISDSIWYIISKTSITTGLLFSVWWELFDGFYNKLRKFRWRFNGSVDDDDSLLDRLLCRIGDTWEGILKIGLIITFLISYIFIK